MGTGKRILHAGLGAALTVVVAACATVPGTERSQLLLLSPSDEVQLGRQAFQQVREDLDLLESGPRKEQVERIGRDIVRVAAGQLAQRGFDDLDWEFHVADSDQVNAFVLPAGKVVFYTGLLDLAESDDEVAAVMGHEVAHVIARHAGERMSQNVLITTGLGAAQIALGGEDAGTRRATMAALGLGATIGVQLPFSRKHEAEADEIGLFLTARAGYDPRAAISFWERMAEDGGDRPPEFLSTHPGPQNRANRLRELMPEAMRIYRQEASFLILPAG